MKKLNILFIIIWIILAIGWKYYYNKIQATKWAEVATTNFTLSQATIWNIENKIKVLGSAELVDEQRIRFTQLWKVIKVNFSEWNTVKKWDIIAELDSEDAYNDIKKAEISLQNTQITLQDLLEWNEEQQILQAANNVEDTKRKINIAKQEYEALLIDKKNDIEKSLNDINILEKQIEESKENISLLEKELSNTIESEEKKVNDTETNNQDKITDAIESIRADLTDASDIITETDELLWVTEINRNKNDSFENYLWAKDSTSKNQAEILLREIIKQYEEINTAFLSNKDTTDSNIIIWLLESNKELYNSIINCMEYTKKTIEASVVTSSLTENTINSYKSSFSSLLSKSQSTLNSINSTITNLQTLDSIDMMKDSSITGIEKDYNSLISRKTDLEKQENDLIQKEKEHKQMIENLNINIKSKQNTITNYEAQLKINEENYQDIKDGADEDDIQKARNNVYNQQLSLEATKNRLDNYRLEAPFEGVVRKIDFKIGDNLVSDDTKYVYLENPDLLEVSIMLDQIDIVKVKLDQKVEIEFDAYPNEIFTWYINEIDSTPINQSGVTSYEAKIAMNKWDHIIYSGMTTTTNIIITEVKNAIIVSSTAIQSMKNKTILQVQSPDGTFKPTLVKIGITDGINTQIISGVESGDTIKIQQITSKAWWDFKAWWGTDAMKAMRMSSGMWGGKK